MSSGEKIKKLIRQDDTILRLGGCGCGFPMTWAADDRQFAVLIDGTGFAKPARGLYHSRILTVSGSPPNPVFDDVATYPEMLLRLNESGAASFWGGACLAVDGHLYQHLTTSNHPWFGPGMSHEPDFYWMGSKLIYSPDNGLTWHNQDGSSPVVLEEWEARSRSNMVFFEEEPLGAFAWLTFLQMGRDYKLNRDGYVYAYSPNGSTDGAMNEVVMIRVPKSLVLDRHSYEFFAGARPDGSAIWTKDIASRSVVHTFPRGWVNTCILGQTPWAWVPSVSYNAPLDLYLMASWGTGSTPERGWFVKPSYLGFWVAPTPWGPFTQIHEESTWTPGNDCAARGFMPQIAPKWISPDGRSFWLVWSDYQFKGSKGEVEHPDRVSIEEVRQAMAGDENEYPRVFLEYTEKHMRHYEFNVQRVDVSLY